MQGLETSLILALSFKETNMPGTESIHRDITRFNAIALENQALFDKKIKKNGNKIKNATIKLSTKNSFQIVRGIK